MQRSSWACLLPASRENGARQGCGSFASCATRSSPVNQRLAVVERIAGEALEHGPEDRAGFIHTSCTGDEALRIEVEAWLSDHEAAEGFLETPVLVVPGDVHDAMPPGIQVPGYRLISELGHGGMGVVYMAEQQRPRRTVALKVIRPEFITNSTLRRFEHEAEVLARLQHPGIAQIFEVGVRRDGG